MKLIYPRQNFKKQVQLAYLANNAIAPASLVNLEPMAG
jgi:hypothetical protein